MFAATVVLLAIYLLTALCVSRCVILHGIYLHVPCWVYNTYTKTVLRRSPTPFPYMYPANSNGTTNCNSTYNDSLMLLWGAQYSSTYTSLTQSEVQNVQTYNSCALSGNPGIFIQRWQ